MASEAEEDPKLSSVPQKKKKTKKKRRRVSKHIEDSKKADTTEEPQDAIATKTAPDTNDAVPLSKKPKTESKEKALEYLERWKNDVTSWKFNKKLQTVLLRNMYDASFVPKHSFEVLISYILPNESLRERIHKEATVRAIRYQRHLEGTDTASYDKLSEHDQRKEYKRARKLLEALEAYRA